MPGSAVSRQRSDKTILPRNIQNTAHDTNASISICAAQVVAVDEVVNVSLADFDGLVDDSELLEADDEAGRQELLEGNKDKITPEFFQMLSGLINQVAETSQDPELVEKVKAVNRQVLRYSMQSSLQGE